jgi:hypothetical protein
MYINAAPYMVKAINITTSKYVHAGKDFWSTTISIIDTCGNEAFIQVNGHTLESVTPSINPYVGTERGSDELPF